MAKAAADEVAVRSGRGRDDGSVGADLEGDVGVEASAMRRNMARVKLVPAKPTRGPRPTLAAVTAVVGPTWQSAVIVIALVGAASAHMNAWAQRSAPGADTRIWGEYRSSHPQDP